MGLTYDVIINCIGVESRNKINCDFKSYFNITEKFDNMVIAYLLEKNPQALYISFSSGAVYGKGFSEPATEFSMNYLDVNHIVQEDYYGIARINAETKHRANRELRIIDLRVFSYFSRFINLSDGFFITDVIQAVLNKEVLITDDTNIVRDYVHPKDLFTLILKCIDAGYLNIAFDVSSKMPVSKQKILEFFSSEYDLKYEVRNSLLNASATGQKNNYFSRYYNAFPIGYKPQYASIDTIKEQVGLIL